jgi:polar amino acid transport system substrate-binding protein
VSRVARRVIARPLGRLAACVALMAACAAAAARPLADVQVSKQLSLCANPNALPFSSERGVLPGFQIEIARALAQRMGLELQVLWIVPRYRASTVDCDMLMDTILSPGVEQRGLKPSMPYQVGGVGLVFTPGQSTVPDYKSLPAGMRVGVMMNSLASLVISRTPAAMVPFGFEEDMLEAVARGDVQAGAVSLSSAGYYNLRHPTQPLQVVRAQDHEPELRWQLAVGLRRADDALVNAVNAALKTLLDDGAIGAIYTRYGIEHRRP